VQRNVFFINTVFINSVIHNSAACTLHLFRNSSFTFSSFPLWSSSPFAPYHPLHRGLPYCIHLSGEIFELKAELNSDKKDRKKEAVKKVIASMTVGKDVR